MAHHCTRALSLLLSFIFFIEFQVVVLGKTCYRPPVLRHATMRMLHSYSPVLSDIYRPGETVKYICKSGFIRTGFLLTTCRRNGKWSKPFGACIKRPSDTEGVTGSLIETTRKPRIPLSVLHAKLRRNPVIRLKEVVVLNSTWVLVKWNTLTARDVIEGYNIRTRHVRDPRFSSYGHSHVTRVPHPNFTYFVLKGLKANEWYDIQVQAYARTIRSRFSNYIRIQTQDEEKTHDFKENFRHNPELHAYREVGMAPGVERTTASTVILGFTVHVLHKSTLLRPASTICCSTVISAPQAARMQTARQHLRSQNFSA